MPMRGEISLPPLLGQGDNLPTVLNWRSTLALPRNPDFLAVCGFSLIGLFSWLILAMQFPSTDEMAALLNQF
jgi:hypothetical protein